MYRLQLRFDIKTVQVGQKISKFNKVQLLSKQINRAISDYIKNNHLQTIVTKSERKTVLRAGLWISRPEVVAIYNWRYNQNTFIISSPELAKRIDNIVLKALKG